MKIIHCADIHLDSALNTNLTPHEAQRRRNEILLTFQDMVAYAARNGVRAIIIAGDLFDSQAVSWNTTAAVHNCIEKNPQIDFLYLAGNHDEQTFLSRLHAYQNLKRFPEAGCSYRYGNVVITGISRPSMGKNISFDERDINIAVMHAALADASGYSGKNINYLALGHYHQYQTGKIDSRGVYCYSGCLEPRGFDECGQTGFVLLSVDDGGIKARFIPFGRRRAWLVPVNVSGSLQTPLACEAIERALTDIPEKDMVKVQLTGSVEAGTQLDFNYIRQYFNERYFAFRLEDRTRLGASLHDYAQELSLKGTFIRTVLASAETEALKKDIIQCGLEALAGGTGLR